MREKLPSRRLLRKLLVFLAICWIILQMFAYMRLFNAYTCVESESGSCTSKRSIEHSRHAESIWNAAIACIFIGTGFAYIFSKEK